MLHIARKPENDPSSFDHVDKSVYICIYLQTPKMITKLNVYKFAFQMIFSAWTVLTGKKINTYTILYSQIKVFERLRKTQNFGLLNLVFHKTNSLFAWMI